MIQLPHVTNLPIHISISAVLSLWHLFWIDRPETPRHCQGSKPCNEAKPDMSVKSPSGGWKYEGIWRVISECPAELVFATRLEKTQPSFSLFATPGSTQSWNDTWKDSFQHRFFQGPDCTLHFIFFIFMKSVSLFWSPNVIANCKVKLELWTYKSNAGSSERITNLVWENIVSKNLKDVKTCHKLFIEPGSIHCEVWPQAQSVQTERKLSGWSDLIASHIHSPKPYPAACIKKNIGFHVWCLNLGGKPTQVFVHGQWWSILHNQATAACCKETALFFVWIVGPFRRWII